MRPFFCISYYEGDLAWLPLGSGYIIYAKAPISLPHVDRAKVIYEPNVGYNIYSYCSYIVDRYDDLPEIIVFTKSNVVPRHVDDEIFRNLCQRRVFTAIEQPSRWEHPYPASMLSSDNGFLEVNSSWYTHEHQLKYFGSFDDFYRFIFDTKEIPRYLRFAPGGNYVVPREHVLLRSRNFYRNLREIVAHHRTCGEAHMAERALHAIWNSTCKESMAMASEAPILPRVNGPNERLPLRVKRKAKTVLAGMLDRL